MSLEKKRLREQHDEALTRLQEWVEGNSATVERGYALLPLARPEFFRRRKVLHELDDKLMRLELELQQQRSSGSIILSNSY